MLKANMIIDLTDLKNVLEITLEELKRNKNKLSTTLSTDEKEAAEVW